jgi:hypothetical protein
MMLIPLAAAQKVVVPTQTAPSPVPSQQPNPTPSDQPKDQGDFQKPNTEEHGTENVPLIVKIIPTEPSPERKQQAKEKAELDRQLTDFTGDLALRLMHEHPVRLNVVYKTGT